MSRTTRFFVAVVAAIACLITVDTTQAQSKSKDEAHVVGDKASDFDLEGIGKKNVKLSSYLGDKGKNVVVVFSRANW